MTEAALGAALGALLGVGLLLVLTSVPRWRQVDLVDRLEVPLAQSWASTITDRNCPPSDLSKYT